MIAKGNLHGDGAKLAAYLVTGKDGERAELVELRGFPTDDIRDAFIAAQLGAEAKTRSTKPFFHAYVRLIEGEALDRGQWQRVADRIEQQLGFQDQPRAVAFHHLANGETHMHLAWSRIDLEHECAIDPGLYKLKLKEVCRQLEHELGLTPVRNERDPEQKTLAPGRNEFEQARRLGTDLTAMREAIRDCWERSDTGRGFEAALAEQGFILARGDKRDFVVIDPAGGDHALGKRITGATAGRNPHAAAPISTSGNCRASTRPRRCRPSGRGSQGRNYGRRRPSRSARDQARQGPPPRHPTGALRSPLRRGWRRSSGAVTRGNRLAARRTRPGRDQSARRCRGRICRQSGAVDRGGVQCACRYVFAAGGADTGPGPARCAAAAERDELLAVCRRAIAAALRASNSETATGNGSATRRRTRPRGAPIARRRAAAIGRPPAGPAARRRGEARTRWRRIVRGLESGGTDGDPPRQSGTATAPAPRRGYRRRVQEGGRRSCGGPSCFRPSLMPRRRFWRIRSTGSISGTPMPPGSTASVPRRNRIIFSRSRRLAIAVAWPIPSPHPHRLYDAEGRQETRALAGDRQRADRGGRRACVSRSAAGRRLHRLCAADAAGRAAADAATAAAGGGGRCRGRS